MTPFDAVQRAVEKGLDLVEVAPSANPPVCRIMDYGKYKYELKKKQAVSKHKAHAATMKEVKLRPRTDEHDLDFKLKNARRFLIEGDKVKVTLMFRGREIVHTSIGREQLDRVKEMLADIAAVENPPRMDGRFMSMILVPNREAIQRLERARAQQEKSEAATESDAADVQQTESDAPQVESDAPQVGTDATQAETEGEAPPAGES
jgi:translation initiation factor IF-3